MEWFRFYTRTLDSVDAQTLPDDLFRAWVNLMCLARIHDGPLPDIKQIAFRLRLTARQAQETVSALIAGGFLERDATGGLVVAGWEDAQRASDSSAERTRLYRSRLKGKAPVTGGNRHGDVTVTQERRGDKRREEKTNTLAALAVRACERWDEWIALWPRVPHPDEARRAWVAAVHSAGDVNGAFSARDRYLASDEVSRGIIQDPGKFLEQQARCAWTGKWPAVIPRAPAGRADATVDRALAVMLERNKRPM
jgi:hypothetical protein